MEFRMKLRSTIVLSLTVLLACNKGPLYMNTNADVDKRAADLVSRMTVEEKISQMSHLAPGIERLNVVPYEPNFDNPLVLEDHPDYTQGPGLHHE